MWARPYAVGMPVAGWGQPHGWTPAAAVTQAQAQWQQQQQQQEMQAASTNRAVVAGTSSAAKPVANAGAVDRYVAFTEGADAEEFVIQTLVGEFVPKGENHGRTFFQKAPMKPNSEPPEVYLYFWDDRDGPTFNGWWFGKVVGGNEVWSHNPGTSVLPPARGWKIPFAGPVRDTFCVMSKAEQSQARAGPKLQGQSLKAPENKEKEKEKEKRVQDLGEAITKAVTEAASATEKAKATVGNYSSVEALRESEKVLTPYATLLGDLDRKLQAIGSISELAKTYGQKLRFALTTSATELSKIHVAIPKAIKTQADMELETKNRATLEELLKETNEKANAAEDLVEKTVITSALIEQAGDDLVEAQKAVDETEVAAVKAQLAIRDGLALIGAKLAAVRRFESPVVRDQAPRELNSLRDKLKAANQKLAPMLTVKQDFRMRTVAKQICTEVSSKLAMAEVKIDRAADTVAPLRTGSVTAETVKQAERTIAEANENLSATQKILEMRMRTAVGYVKQELVKVEQKWRAGQKRLDDVRVVYKEIQERQTCSSLLPEVGEKMHAVHVAVNGAQSILSPCLMDEDDLTLSETLAAIKAGDEAMKGAVKATSAAKISIAMKLVEVKRFTAEAGQEAQRQLQDYQRELEIATKKVNELKSAMADRKQVALKSEAKERVDNAEQLARRVAEVAGALEDERRLAEMPAEEVRQVGGTIREAEAAALKALREAQELITQRQIEAKGSGAPEGDVAVLKAYQERLRVGQADVARFKTLPAVVEEQLVLKRALDEAEAKIAATEEKVDRAAALIKGLSEEDAKPDPRGAEAAMQSAQVALKGLSRYLEAQQQRCSKVPEEMAKLSARMKQAEERISGLTTEMQEGSEKVIARGLLQEVEQRVKEAEESVQKASEAAAPFLREDAEEEDSSRTVAHLRDVVYGGNKALGSAKTFLAVKKIAAKRFIEPVAKTSLQALATLQGRLDMAAKSLADLQKGTSDRKYLKLKQEALGKFEVIEAKVKAFKEAVSALEDSDDKDIAPLAMKEIFEKAGGTQQEAQRAIDGLRPMVSESVREAKAGESPVLNEFKDLLTKLKTVQEDVDLSKRKLSDREQKFVARRLLKDATQMFEDLEAKLERTNSAAVPLVSAEPADKQDFVAAVFLLRIAEALRQYASRESQSLEDLFDDVCDGGATLTEEKFVEFVLRLPEFTPEAARPTQEQLKASFAFLGPRGSATVALDDFKQQLKRRYYCTSVVAMTGGLKVDGGKSVRKLELWEPVEALEPPVKDDDKAVTRVKARAEKDGKEGYCTLSGNQGTVYLEPCSAYTTCLRTVALGLQDTADSINQTMAYLKQKSEEIASVQGAGSLGEVKAELMKMRVRASKAQTTHSALKKRVAEAQRKLEKELEQVEQRRREAVDKAEADALINEATEMLEELKSEVEGAASTAEEFLTAEGRRRPGVLEAMDSADAEVDTALALVTKAQEKLLKAEDGKAMSSLGEARRTLKSLRGKLAPLEQKCKQLRSGLHESREQVLMDAQEAVAAVLKTHCERTQLAPERLFAKLSQGGKEVSAQALRKALMLECKGTPKALLELGLKRCGALSKLGFTGLFQEFKRCVREIALTTNFNVKTSATVRKLDVGEFVELLGEKSVEESTGLTRAKCRACRDAAEGYVTITGNQGTAFLEKMPKPYYLATAPGALLHEACATSSTEVRPIQVGELLEALEGPKREPLLELVRFRGKALRDGKTGWATLKEPRRSTPNFEQTRVLVCKGSIAITNAFNIGECVSLRKLEVGEILEQLEEPQLDEERKLCRVHLRAQSDGREGWATVKGNQGTVYLAESPSHYTCSLSTPLEKNMTSGEQPLRQLDEGEIFEVLEGPFTENKQGALRVHGRALQDGADGWFSLDGAMQLWAAPHRCAQATDLREAAAADAKVLRPLQVGELLEALEPPEPTRWMRMRAAKDGIVGFAAPVAADGKQRLLEPAIVPFEEA